MRIKASRHADRLPGAFPMEHHAKEAEAWAIRFGTGDAEVWLTFDRRVMLGELSAIDTRAIGATHQKIGEIAATSVTVPFRLSGLIAAGDLFAAFAATVYAAGLHANTGLGGRGFMPGDLVICDEIDGHAATGRRLAFTYEIVGTERVARCLGSVPAERRGIRAPKRPPNVG